MATFPCRCYRTAGPTSSLGPWISKTCGLRSIRGCRRGRVSRIADLATELLATREQVRSGLLTLAAARHLALGSDGEITMAHPFGAVPLGFSVMGRTHCGGGCGCDSFALAAGPGSDAGGDDVLGVRPGPCLAGRRPRAAGGQVAHFLVPATRMWDDLVDTCGNQRIFCSEACVATWLNESGHQRGSVLDLQTLWRLAAGWCGPFRAWLCPPRAERCRRLLAQCRALGAFSGLTSG